MNAHDSQICYSRLCAAADAIKRDDPDLTFKFKTDEIEAAVTFLRRLGYGEPPKQKATKL